MTDGKTDVHVHENIGKLGVIVELSAADKDYHDERDMAHLSPGEAMELAGGLADYLGDNIGKVIETDEHGNAPCEDCGRRWDADSLRFNSKNGSIVCPDCDPEQEGPSQ